MSSSKSQEARNSFPSAPLITELVTRLQHLSDSITGTLRSLKEVQLAEQAQSKRVLVPNGFEISCSVLSLSKLVRTARSNIASLEDSLPNFEDIESTVTSLGGTKVEDKNKGYANESLAEAAKSNSASPSIREATYEKTLRPSPWPLEKEEYERYGRQLIMPEIGLQGQLRLKHCSVLIVGLGGLGCPAAKYLAGAGVGTLGLVDGDTVEVSNLHRQILHLPETVGWSKVESAMHSLQAYNPLVKYNAYLKHLTPQNSLSIFAGYDLILDCTDRPTSRYLISDTAVLLKKPLVSASALRLDGQLTVLNNPPTGPGNPGGGPCYRCIFPKPPPADSVVSCGEGGILGPVVGVMGVLQALEAIKLLVAKPPSQAESQRDESAPSPSLLIFSAYGTQPFRSVRLRGRKATCPACSAEASITKESLTSGSLDYVQFCGTVLPVDALTPDERLTPSQYALEREKVEPLDSGSDSVLVDVRERTQFELCSMPGSINIPFSEISAWKFVEDGQFLRDKLRDKRTVRFVCRLGNDSQLAIRKIKELGILERENRDTIGLADIRGGWSAWKRDIDEDWPDF